MSSLPHAASAHTASADRATRAVPTTFARPSAPLALTEPGPALEPGVLLAALWDDVSDAAFVLSDSLRVLWSNRSGAELLAAHSTDASRAGTPADKANAPSISLGDMLPASVASERRAVMHALTEPGSCVRVVGMLFGRWTRVVYRALPPAPTSNGQATTVKTWLAVHTMLTECGGPVPRAGEPGPSAVGPGEARAQADDLGDLSDLTERELQVLRLIGLGLSTQEMSRAMERSIKTVEGHRLSLGEKLTQGSKVGLSRLAVSAGLTLLPPEEIARIAHRAARRRDPLPTSTPQ